MADRHSFVLPVRVAVLCLIALPQAFAAQPSRRAVQDLAALQALLAGRFDTAAQSHAEPEAGTTNRVPLQRVLVPARAGFIGDVVYYMQETVQGDERRILSQQLLLLEALPGSGLLVTSPLSFNEPLRWRDGARSPEVFRSILPQDVKALAGCEVVWRKVTEGFDGATDPGRCRLSSEGSSYRLEQRYQLRVSGFTLQERRFDETGRLVAEEPLLQFRRLSP